MTSLLRDLRFALRILWRSPTLTLSAVVVLALGIGANAAVFSVVYRVLLKAPPVDEPARLVSVHAGTEANPGLHAASWKNFEELRRAPGVPALAAYAPVPMGIADADDDRPEQVSAEMVTGNYFSLLGVRLAAGRGFLAEEDSAAGAHPVAVISHALWMRRFGGRPGVVGQTVKLNQRDFTVVGVAPPAFTGLDLLRAVDVWVPVAMHDAALTGVERFYFAQRSAGMFEVVGRLRSGATPEEASARLASAARDLARTYPDDNRGLELSVLPLQAGRIDPNRRGVYLRVGTVLTAVVAMVLLIGCASVANLLLARAAARRREIAVRLAVGTTRARLVRQLLAESLVLAFVGGAAGLVVAWLALRLIDWLRPAGVPGDVVRLDPAALAFTLGLSVATAALFGMVPALQASRVDLVSGLKGEASSTAAARRAAGWDTRALLLGAQALLASMALIAAGLFLQNLRHVRRIDPGFEPRGLMVVSYDLGMLRLDNQAGSDLTRRMVERVRALPGVASASVSTRVMLDGGGIGTRVTPEGGRESDAVEIGVDAVDLDFFRTAGVPVVAGRDFRPTDTGQSEFGWAVVNETMARRLWPGRDPLQQRFRVQGIPQPYQVVGVARDARYERLDEEPRPFFYMYYHQVPGVQKLTLYVRAAGDPAALAAAVRREAQAAAPGLTLGPVRTADEVLAQATWAPRMGAGMLLLFGLVALVLAAVGTYGVTAYSVSQRVREIGIRIALGARTRHIVRAVLVRGMVPTLAGTFLGIALWLALGGVVRPLLSAGAASAPVIFAVVALVLSGVAAAACCVPALRAARVSPARVARQD